MTRGDVLRGVVLAAICLGVLVYDWNYLAWPMHRVMALMVVTVVLVFAWFYEMTVRDAPSGQVLVGVLAIISAAFVAWLGLTLLVHPLPDDDAPLIAAGESLDMQGCTAPPGTLTVAVGADRISGTGRGAFTPFKVGSCPGPSLSVTSRGLMVEDHGYDDDGNMAFKIRHNLFERLFGDWLHIHRPDRHSLGVYDRWEKEILYVRYVAPGQVRVRGRFLCGDSPPVVIRNDSVTVGEARYSHPACLLDRQRRY